MKICQLCAVDFTMARFLLPLMRGLREAGHEVVGVSADGPLLDQVRDDGFRVECVPIERSLRPVAHLAACRLLVALFRKERFDIVHVHTPVAALIGRLAAWRAGVPRIVYTAHGFYFHEHMPWWKRAPVIALEWLAGRVTDVLFTQAEEDAATARRLHLCRGVIEAIGNGTDPARFGPDAAIRVRVREALETPADRIVVVMIGRLVAEKGLAELFAAMAAVPEAELWIIGERLASDHAVAIDAALATVRAEPALDRRIRLLGLREDVPDLLRAADIFTLPSWREGMPRSIIEAMMSGLPVVATNIRGTREEIVDGETGLLVPLRDTAALGQALAALAADPSRRARMGGAGRERALALYDEARVVARQVDRLGAGRG